MPLVAALLCFAKVGVSSSSLPHITEIIIINSYHLGMVGEGVTGQSLKTTEKLQVLGKFIQKDTNRVKALVAVFEGRGIGDTEDGVRKPGGRDTMFGRIVWESDLFCGSESPTKRKKLFSPESGGSLARSWKPPQVCAQSTTPARRCRPGSSRTPTGTWRSQAGVGMLPTLSLSSVMLVGRRGEDRDCTAEENCNEQKVATIHLPPVDPTTLWSVPIFN
jgi:hypothetical protein